MGVNNRAFLALACLLFLVPQRGAMAAVGLSSVHPGVNQASMNIVVIRHLTSCFSLLLVRIMFDLILAAAFFSLLVIGERKAGKRSLVKRIFSDQLQIVPGLL